jgi:uncharacterized phage protein (TIGR01671 family)
MREIKFRAWDEDEMIYFRLENLSSGLVGDKDNHISSMELMQYTGLKDKNGKEVYEGDIIRDCNGLDCTWVVQWIDSEACYGGLDWCGNPNEVIGNIYENPELMEGVNDNNRQL